MKKLDIIFKTLMSLTIVIFITSCEIDSFAESDEHSFGDIVAPSNVQVTADIKGQDADTPNGDGSGVVDFTVTAENAISYKFVYNGMEQLQADGTTTMNFTSLGVNKYTVVAIAVGVGGTTSSQAISVEVLVSYTPPAELIDALTSGTWKLSKDEGGHLGVAAGIGGGGISDTVVTEDITVGTITGADIIGVVGDATDGDDELVALAQQEDAEENAGGSNTGGQEEESLVNG